MFCNQCCGWHDQQGQSWVLGSQTCQVDTDTSAPRVEACRETSRRQTVSLVVAVLLSRGSTADQAAVGECNNVFLNEKFYDSTKVEDKRVP
eukprot:m.54365 g.54365  ORF g.54365 m.54365 type:complete len:91 (+) comp7522_c0_seq2:1190-1462(+)